MNNDYYVNIGLRASGKTYEMIKQAAWSNTPILVTDRIRATNLKQYAKTLGYNIKCVYPVAVGIYISDSEKGDPINGDILIDDADEVLSDLLYHNNVDELNVKGMNISYKYNTFLHLYPEHSEKLVDVVEKNLKKTNKED